MSASAARFDHEKLDVYRVELELVAWLGPLLEEVREGSTASVREVIHQLDRASISMILNTAEGNGRRGSQQRCRFFDDARGSATECAACLDVLVATGLCRDDRVSEGQAMLLRVVGMLTRLVDRFDGGTARVREDAAEYGSGLSGGVDFEGRGGGEDEGRVGGRGREVRARRRAP